MKIAIDNERCVGSGECVKVCPEQAITLVDGLAVIDTEKCDLDGICIPACPQGAILYKED